MRRSNYFAPLLAATALCLAVATPAHAEGKADRARQAIAEAQTKIETAESMGTSTAQPAQTAEANAALAHAKENLAAGHKPEAIEDAIRASALADTALGMMQKHAQQHNEAVQAQASSDNAARAQATVDNANQQANMANDRAARAEDSAAASANEAAAARNAAAMTVQNAQPTQVQTTVTTERADEPAAAPRRAAVHRVAAVRVTHHRRHHTVRHGTKVTTKTTVTHNGM